MLDHAEYALSSLDNAEFLYKVDVPIYLVAACKHSGTLDIHPS